MTQALATPVMLAKRKSVNESLEADTEPRRLSKTRLSLPALSAPRLSLTDTDRLLDATKRSIEIDKLEKYILGKKSVELEIEFGIPRSQLCRWADFVKYFTLLITHILELSANSRRRIRTKMAE